MRHRRLFRRYRPRRRADGRAVPGGWDLRGGVVTAGQIAKRIAIVTTLPRSIVPLQELVRRYGFAERADVTACDVAVLDLEKPGSGAEAKLEAEIARALDKGAEAIVLGCAGMADLTQKLSRKFGVPVVDGVAAAVKQAEALAGLKLTTSRRGSYASPGVKKYEGMLALFAPKTSEQGAELISPEVSQFQFAV